MNKYTLFGFYRAKVLENKDPDKFGKIKVWIPDIMPDIEPVIHPKIEYESTNGSDDAEAVYIGIDKGIWAWPANNPVGGRSDIEDQDQWGQGTCYIPKLGAYVWVFFEGGNINRPFYFGSLDIEISKVLPENQAGKEYQNKWTIFKSSQGRTIVISDDCDERIELTGKKRKLKKSKEHPEGDIDSVYEIEENQTTVVLEEIDGKEQLFVKTWQGDFINVKISKRELHCYFKNDIYIKTDSNFYIDAVDINLNAVNNIYMTSKNSVNISSEDTYVFGNNTLSLKSETNTLIYGGEFVNILAESDLLLTGYESIHQYTSLNLLGGDINIGLVVPRKADAGEAATAGDAGDAGECHPNCTRFTNKDCKTIPDNNKPPNSNTNPSKVSDKVPKPTPDPDPDPTSGVKGLVPNGIQPDDIFELVK